MMSRRLKILLAVSLLLNLLVMGIIGGAVYRWQQGDLGAAIAARQIGRLRAAAEALEPANREAYLRALRTVRRDSEPLMREARLARRDAMTAFVAPTFDKGAVERALERARAADFTLRSRVENAVIEVSATMPPEQRDLLARGLRRAGPFQQPPNAAETKP